MNESSRAPERYTIGNLISEARTQLPYLLRERNQLVPGFRGIHRLPATARVAVHMRSARIFGCPVCAELFPRIAARQGFTDEEIAAISAGLVDDLPDEIRGAVEWASAVLEGGGDAPFEVPESARALSDEQLSHLQYMMRLERLIHATGLVFLPHSLIERTATA